MKTFDYEVTLIGKEPDGQDEYLNLKYKESRKTMLCNRNSIGRNEFYKAGEQNLKLEYILTIHDFEYEGEQEVELEGKKLYILRTWKQDGLMELTVGEKVG